MNLTVKKSDLFAILSKAASVTENKATMPVLSCVLLDAQGDTLSVSAYDLEVAYVGLIEAIGTKPGKVAVSAKALGDVVRSLPEEVVHLYVEKNRLVVTSGSAEFRLATTNAEEYPALPEGVAGVGFNVDGSTFAKLLSKVAYAQSHDETRYSLNGTFLEGQNGLLTATATDGHRLVNAGVDVKAPEFKGVIVSRKTTGLLRRVLVAGEASVEVSENALFVTQGHEVIVARLIDGAFPDYAAIYPKTAGKSTVAVKDALAVLGRLKLVSDSGKWTVGEDFVTLKSVDPDLGEVEDRLVYEGEGPKAVFGVNGAYVREALSTVEGDKADFYFPADDLSPMIIRSPSMTDGYEDYAIIMPMRVK